MSQELKQRKGTSSSKASKSSSAPASAGSGFIGLQANDSQLHALHDLKAEDEREEEQEEDSGGRWQALKLVFFICALLLIVPNIAQRLTEDKENTLEALQCRKAGDRNNIYLALDENGNCVPAAPLPHSISGARSEGKWFIFSKQELQSHGGEMVGEATYGCILGQCFDLSNTPQGSPLEALYGRDGSRLITFPKASAAPSDLVEDLDDSQLRTLARWLRFLQQHQAFAPVGVLIGKHYNFNGQETEEGKRLQEKLLALEKKWDEDPVAELMDTLKPLSQADEDETAGVFKCRTNWGPDTRAAVTCGPQGLRFPRQALTQSHQEGKEADEFLEHMSASLPLDGKDCICVPTAKGSLEGHGIAEKVVKSVVLRPYAGCDAIASDCIR